MADPELDYYQPLTVRLFTYAGRQLEHLARVVAPPDEVRRYMDGVMRGMTRAEYVLLAMRLPRGGEGEGEEEKGEKEGKEKARVNGSGKEKDKEKEKESEAANRLEVVSKPASTGGVLWTAKMPKPEFKDLPPRSRAHAERAADPDEQYQRFIASVSRKEEA